MLLAVTLNGVLQFAYAIALAFCIGDEEKVATSAQPVLEIYYQATKSKIAATIVLLMHQFVSLVGLFNIVASASRLTWAFARDKGLPFSGFFVHVSDHLLHRHKCFFQAAETLFPAGRTFHRTTSFDPVPQSAPPVSCVLRTAQ